MIYLKNSGIEIYNKGACSKTLYFLAAERVEPPVPDGCCVVMIYPYEWTEMMTPWQHSGKGMGKTGGGAEFSQEFVPNLLTYVENGLEDKVVKRGIAGYSLGGLEAFYMACVAGIFDFAGSVSGSFWYPGAVEYFEKNPMFERVRNVYMSLGEREERAKDPERRTVRRNTDAIAERLEAARRLRYEINCGGHFTDIEKRIGNCAGYFAGT